MSDPVARLNAALEGCYAIERELGEGGVAQGVGATYELRETQALEVRKESVMIILSGLFGSSCRRRALPARHGHRKRFALAGVFVVFGVTGTPAAAQDLAEAAAAGDLSMVHALLADGADVNSDTHPSSGRTALMTASQEVAIFSEQRGIEQILLAAGDARTTRDVASHEVDVSIEMNRLLLDAGAEVD